MKLENGALDICLKKDAEGNWNDATGDRFSGLQLTGPEWHHIFNVVLQVPDQFDTTGEQRDIYEYFTSQERQFQDFVTEKGFRMLSRIRDLYQDVVFHSGDIESLRNECVALGKSTDDELALSGLAKLSLMCEEALESSSGLVLISD